jgi:hypothetical protein
MPCYQTGSQLGDAELSASEARKAATAAARAACEALELIHRHNIQAGLSPETQRWYEVHKRVDRERPPEPPAPKLRIQQKQEADGWSLYVNGVRWIEGETYQVVSNVAAELAVPGSMGNSECTEIADSIRKHVVEQ